MLTRIQIHLAEDELRALQSLALSEMRGLREQIRFVLRQDLERRGLLAIPAPTPPVPGPEAQAVPSKGGEASEP